MNDARWEQYLLLQAYLLDPVSANCNHLAMEAVANRLLDNVDDGFIESAPVSFPNHSFINTELCRERRQARLRAIHIVREEPQLDGESAMQAVLILSELKSTLREKDFVLLSMKAQGYSSAEIAKTAHLSSAAVRTNLCRLRRLIAA